MRRCQAASVMAPLPGRKKWHCHYCKLAVTSVSELVAHVCGDQHASKVHHVFTPTPEPPSRLQDFLGSYVGEQHPVLGLQHIEETLAGGAHPTYMYHCQLCDRKGDWKSITCHLMSEEHIHTYILNNHRDMVSYESLPEKMRLPRLMATAVFIQKKFGRKQIQHVRPVPGGRDHAVFTKDPQPPECTKIMPKECPPDLQSVQKMSGDQQVKSVQPPIMDGHPAVPTRDPRLRECTKNAPSQHPSDAPLHQSVQKTSGDWQIKSVQPPLKKIHPAVPARDPHLRECTKNAPSQRPPDTTVIQSVQKMSGDQQVKSVQPPIMDGHPAVPTSDPQLPEYTRNAPSQRPSDAPLLQSVKKTSEDQHIKSVQPPIIDSHTAMPTRDPRLQKCAKNTPSQHTPDTPVFQSVQKMSGDLQIKSVQPSLMKIHPAVPTKDPRLPEYTKNAPSQRPPDTPVLQSVQKTSWDQHIKSVQPPIIDNHTAVPTRDPRLQKCANNTPSQQPPDNPVIQSVQKMSGNRQIKSVQPPIMDGHPAVPTRDSRLQKCAKNAPSQRPPGTSILQSVQKTSGDWQIKSVQPPIIESHTVVPTRDPRLQKCAKNAPSQRIPDTPVFQSVQKMSADEQIKTLQPSGTDNHPTPPGSAPRPPTCEKNKHDQHPPETPALQCVQKMSGHQQIKSVQQMITEINPAMPTRDPPLPECTNNTHGQHPLPVTLQCPPGTPDHQRAQNMFGCQQLKYVNSAAMGSETAMPAGVPWNVTPGTEQGFLQHVWQMQAGHPATSLMNYNLGDARNIILAWWASQQALFSAAGYPWPGQNLNNMMTAKTPWVNALRGWSRSPSPISLDKRPKKDYDCRVGRSRSSSREASRERLQGRKRRSNSKNRCSCSSDSSEERRHDRRKARKSRSRSRERSPKDYGRRSVYKRRSRSPYSSEERRHERRRARKSRSRSRVRSTKDYGRRSVNKRRSRSPYSSEERHYERRKARKSRSCSREKSPKDNGRRSVNKRRSRSIGKSGRDSHSGERQRGRKQDEVRRSNSKEKSRDQGNIIRSHSREASEEESRSEERHHRKVIDTKRLPKARSEELLKPKDKIHKQVTKAKKKPSSSSSSSGESSAESSSSEERQRKKHNQESSSPHNKVECEETTGGLKKNMCFDDLQNIDIEDEEDISRIRKFIQNNTNEMKRFLQEGGGLTRDASALPTPAEPQTQDISVTDNEQLSPDAEQCNKASTSEVILRDREQASPQAPDPPSSSDRTNCESNFETPTPVELDMPYVTVSDNEESSSDNEQHENTSTPEIIPRDHKPAPPQAPDPLSSPDRTNSESDSQTATIGGSSHSEPASIFQESFDKKIPIQEQKVEKVTASEVRVVKTGPTHHNSSVSDSHPEAALNVTGGSHAGSPRLPLNPLPTDVATEMFFSSIKNMTESEVFAVFQKIAATNPAFRCVNIPALMHFLKATDKVKKN